MGERILDYDNPYFQDGLGLNQSKLFKYRVNTLLKKDIELICTRYNSDQSMYNISKDTCLKTLSDKNNPTEFLSLEHALVNGLFLAKRKLINYYNNFSLEINSLETMFKQTKHLLDCNFISINAYKFRNPILFIDFNSIENIKNILTLIDPKKFVNINDYAQFILTNNLNSNLNPKFITNISKMTIKEKKDFYNFFIISIYSLFGLNINNLFNENIPDKYKNKTITIKRQLYDYIKNDMHEFFLKSNINKTSLENYDLQFQKWLIQNDIYHKEINIHMIEKYKTLYSKFTIRKKLIENKFFDLKKKYNEDETKDMNKKSIIDKNNKINIDNLQKIKLIKEEIENDNVNKIILIYKDVFPKAIGIDLTKKYILKSSKGYIIYLLTGGCIICQKTDVENVYNFFYYLNHDSIKQNKYNNRSTGNFDEDHDNTCAFCRISKTRSWITEKDKFDNLLMNKGEPENFMYYDTKYNKQNVPIAMIFPNRTTQNKVLIPDTEKISNNECRYLAITYDHVGTGFEHPNCNKISNGGVYTKNAFDHIKSSSTIEGKKPPCGVYVYKNSLDDETIYYFKSIYDCSKIFAFKKYGKPFIDGELEYDNNTYGQYYKYKKPTEQSQDLDNGRIYFILHATTNSVLHLHMHTWIDSKSTNFYDTIEKAGRLKNNNKIATDLVSNIYNKSLTFDKPDNDIDKQKEKNNLLYLGKITDNLIDLVPETDMSLDHVSFEFTMKFLLGITVDNNNDFVKEILNHHWIFEQPDYNKEEPVIIPDKSDFTNSMITEYKFNYNESQKMCSDVSRTIIPELDEFILNKKIFVDSHYKIIDEINTPYLYINKSHNYPIINRNYSDMLETQIIFLLQFILDKNCLDIGGFFDITNPNLHTDHINLNYPKLVLFNNVVHKTDYIPNDEFNTCCNSKNIYQFQLFTAYIITAITFKMKSLIVHKDLVLNFNIIDMFLNNSDPDINIKSELNKIENKYKTTQKHKLTNNSINHLTKSQKPLVNYSSSNNSSGGSRHIKTNKKDLSISRVHYGAYGKKRQTYSIKTKIHTKTKLNTKSKLNIHLSENYDLKNITSTIQLLDQFPTIMNGKQLDNNLCINLTNKMLINFNDAITKSKMSEYNIILIDFNKDLANKIVKYIVNKLPL